jgi:hypothetical protein
MLACLLACAPAAISPGLVKEQQSYVLGNVQDPTLTQALMSMFLEPDHCLDPDFAAAAGVRLLGVINGQRLGKLQQTSKAAAALAAAADAEEASKQMLRKGKWGLPDVGKAPQQLPLVKGVRREVMYHQVRCCSASEDIDCCACVQLYIHCWASCCNDRQLVLVCSCAPAAWHGGYA